MLKWPRDPTTQHWIGIAAVIIVVILIVALYGYLSGAWYETPP